MSKKGKSLSELTAGTPEHDGQKVRACGVEFTVPPLSFRQIKSLKAKIGQLKTAALEDGLDVMLDLGLPVILAAMSRNYPDLTEEQLEDVIDAGNFPAFFGAALGTKVGETPALQPPTSTSLK